MAVSLPAAGEMPVPAEQPLATLRGARVEVDAHRVRRVGAAAGAVALAALAIVLAATGARTNSQIDALRHSGVAVSIVVSGCRAELAGSGSNAAGYACLGSFELGGRRYAVAIPGTVQRLPGEHVSAIAAASDPGLVSTPALLRGDRATWRVYLAPALIMLGLLSLAAVLGRRRRRRGVAAVACSAGSPPD
jgi:hypothetical protein